MNTVNNFPDAIPEMYGFRPQQGLLIMNLSLILKLKLLIERSRFPSPTGATYYEYGTQGITKTDWSIEVSVPNRGYLLWIKNYESRNLFQGFRPQQGLLIMNPYLQNPDKHYLK